MKVLIADDEHLVRFGLRSMIEELNLGLTVVAEAANGEEFLALVAKHQPEICFVDIRMPGLNGLAAIKKARKAGSRARWIILTSHAEFDYASEALQLGASAYLLKPAGLDNLDSVLGPLIKAVEKDHRQDSIRFEHALVAALGSPDSKVSETPAFTAAWLACLRCDVGAGCSPREKQDFPLEVLRQARALLGASLCGSLMTAAWLGPQDQIMLAAAWDKGDLDARNAGARAKEGLGILVRQTAPQDRRLTGFFADGLESWEALTSAAADLKRVVPQSVLMGMSVSHALGSLVHRLEALPPALIELSQRVVEFLQSREQGQASVLEAQAQILNQAFASVGPATSYLNAVAKFLAFRIGAEPPPSQANAAGLVTWLDGVAARVKRELPELKRSADFQERIVEKVDQYLGQNLRSEVRVPDIASVLGLSPNYLSSIYHKLTDSTISERLADLRLDLARELLSKPGSQVKEVAMAVGYKSTRYFAQLYLKRFGHHPSGR